MDDDDSDSRIAVLVAAIIEHFDIRTAATIADLDAALRAHNYLIRHIGTIRPDLYDRLKDLAQARRTRLAKDTCHG